jgi:uncharacterized membrane protein YvlD (DUF360 family)
MDLLFGLYQLVAAVAMLWLVVRVVGEPYLVADFFRAVARMVRRRSR